MYPQVPHPPLNVFAKLTWMNSFNDVDEETKTEACGNIPNTTYTHLGQPSANIIRLISSVVESTFKNLYKTHTRPKLTISPKSDAPSVVNSIFGTHLNPPEIYLQPNQVYFGPN